MLLNNKCPDGYEITRNAKGSKICMKCKGGKSKVKKG
jgi:hypothetical protein